MMDLEIQTQPDDESCGPTCLHAIYTFYGLELPLAGVIKEVDRSLSGGTLSPMLGKHAIQNGFNASIYVYNLNIFDPSWFKNDRADNELLINKLNTQLVHKNDPHTTMETNAFIEFLSLGGQVLSHTLDASLLKKYFAKQLPILTGLSATNLYGSPRELFTTEGKSVYDDIRGTPCGHFVVLCGYDKQKRNVVIADPHAENPLFHNNYYKVSINRLINSILLGLLTYDGNLLIIEPKEN